MVGVVIINAYFGVRFLSAARELKRMESVTRSPLFTLFSDTIVGITTIRAFGMSQQFIVEMLHRMDVNARPIFYKWTASRWVSTRIAVVGAVVAFITGVIILLNLDHINASMDGFCLSYTLAFTTMVT